MLRVGRHDVEPRSEMPLSHLRCCRIVGTATSGPIEFDTGGLETALICVRGRAFVLVADELYEMTPYDALYVPRNSAVRVDADGEGCGLIEVGAPARQDYPVQFLSYGETGGHGADGGAIVLIGDKVKAGRIFAGIAFPGAGPATVPVVADAVSFERASLILDEDLPAPGCRTACLWMMAAR
jgi:hypothetical protein